MSKRQLLTHGFHDKFFQHAIAKCFIQMENFFTEGNEKFGDKHRDVRAYIGGFYDGVRFAESFHKVWDLPELPEVEREIVQRRETEGNHGS